MPQLIKILPRLLAAAIFFGVGAESLAQSTAFTHQGALSANGALANGSYDLTFSLFTNESGGVVAASPLTNLATSLSNGQFTVLLDYGPGIFNGANYWLEIGVRTNGDSNFSILAPRQAITPVPYAIYAQSSQSSAVADSANAVAATNLVGVLTPAQLPAAMVTNNSAGVNLNGVFSGSFGGDASGMTNLNATQLGGGIVPYSVLPSDVIRNGQSGPVAINGRGNGWSYALELTNNACLWLDTGGINQTADNDVQYIPDTQLSMYCMGMDVPFGEVIYGWGRNEWRALEVFMSDPEGTAVDSNWPEGCKTFSLSCAGQMRLWNRLDTLDNAGMIILGQQDPTAYSNYYGIGVSQSNLLFGMTQSNGAFVTTNILIDPSGNLSLYSPDTGAMTVHANVGIDGSEFLTGSLLLAADDAVQYIPQSQNSMLTIGESTSNGIIQYHANYDYANAYTVLTAAESSGAPTNADYPAGAPVYNIGNNGFVTISKQKLGPNLGSMFELYQNDTIATNLFGFDVLSNGLYVGPLIGFGTNVSHDGRSFLFGTNGVLSGDGSGLTNLDASELSGGSLADSLLSDNVALRNGVNTFVGANMFANSVTATNAGNIFAGTFNGDLIGSATTAGSFSGTLSGDVAGPQDSTVVSAVGGQSAASVAGAVALANGATNANFPSAIVQRDSTGSFSATSIAVSNVIVSNAVASASPLVVVSAAQDGNSGRPAMLVQNTSSSSNCPPALQVVGTGQAGSGVLSVAAGGVGLIAQFVSGTNTTVADIQTDGTIDARAFNTTSDRNKKEGFVPVDPRSVLEKVLALPISQWNFKTDAGTRHIGPMAQDFRSLFGVGTDEKHIATVDEEGVALAAIQGLNQRIDDQARQISAQAAQLKTLQQTIAELQKDVSELKREGAASGAGGRYSLASRGVNR